MRKVRPDAMLQAPEIRVPVLMVEVDRSTMAAARGATMAPAPGSGEATAYPRAVPARVAARSF